MKITLLSKSFLTVLLFFIINFSFSNIFYERSEVALFPDVEAIPDSLYPYHPNINVPFSSSNLPILIINLDERMANHSEDRRVGADMILISRTDGARNSISDTVSENLADTAIINYYGRIGIKYRGSSSFSASDKKPFNFETQNINGSNRNVNLLGMGVDEDWTLLAPFNDKSLIRDVLTFDLARGYLEYVPTGKFCELILNGVYEGVYILAARVLRGPTRINLPHPLTTGNSLTGGYLLEIDRNTEPVFYSNHNYRDLYGNNISGTHCYQYKYPESEDYENGMPIQQNYIINHVHQFENIVASDSFKNPETGYRSQIDVISLIDYILTQEITHNVDGYRLSTPIYKYRDNVDPRFKLSIWDFNISLGNANYCDGWSTEGWSWNLNKFSEPEKVPFWFKRILEDEVFRKELRSRWSYYRQTNLSDQNVINKIDSLMALLNEAQSRNFTAWNRWGQSTWPNYYISYSWNEEVNYLKNWILKRIRWMDSQLTPYPQNFVANPSFDSDSRRTASGSSILLSNWKSLNSNLGLSTTVKFNGDYALSIRNYNEVWQSITDLPKGKYTFKAWVRTVYNPQAAVIIRNHNSSAITYPITNSNQFYEIEIRHIEVVTGICDLVFKANFTSGGDTRLYVDSVSFFRQRDHNYPYHPSQNIDLASSNLPIVVINMDTPMSFGSTESNMAIIFRTNGTRNRLSDIDDPVNLTNPSIIDFNGSINLSVTPDNFDKKSFTFTTENISETSILGMNGGQNWRLTASNEDKSLIRELLAGNLFNNSLDYAPELRPCELVINDIYQGIYLLAPDIGNGKDMFDLTTPGTSTPGITGSYLLTVGNTITEGFASEIQNCDLYGNPKENFTHYGYLFPSSEEFSAGMPLQQSYITGLVNDFENVMKGNNFSDPVLGYRKYIDTLSAIKYMLSQEFLRNPEAYRSDLLLLKNSDSFDSRLKLLIPEFPNLTGNTTLYDGWSPEGWVWNQNRFDTINMTPFWFKKLLSDETFRRNLSSLWGNWRQNNLSDNNILYLTDSLSTLLEEGQSRNFTLWNNFTGTVVPNYYTGNSWNEEIQYVRDFLIKRAAWMDRQLLDNPPLNLVANSSFNCDAPRGNNDSLLLSSWSVEGNGNFSNDAFSGLYAYELKENSSLYQTVTELIPGYYTLNAKIKTLETPDAKLHIAYYADLDSIIVYDIFPSLVYNHLIVENIPISSGLCKIDFKNLSAEDYNVLIVDDVVLFYDRPLAISTYNTDNRGCSVYPLPFYNQLFFQYTPSVAKGEVLIYSVTGVLIDRIMVTGEKGILTKVSWNAPENLAPGFYIYYIRDGKNYYSGKLVKM